MRRKIMKCVSEGTFPGVVVIRPDKESEDSPQLRSPTVPKSRN